MKYYGHENWRFSWEPVGNNVTKGTIAIRNPNNPDEWIEKSDVGYPNGKDDAEPLKSSVSDAFKRSAVLWGIGRYLYRIEPVWAKCKINNGKFGGWVSPPKHAPVNKNSRMILEVEPRPVVESQDDVTDTSKPVAKKADIRTKYARGLTMAAQYPIDLEPFTIEDETPDDEVAKLMLSLATEIEKYEVFSDTCSIWKDTYVPLRDKLEEKGLSIPDKKSFKPPMKREILDNAIKSMTLALGE